MRCAGAASVSAALTILACSFGIAGGPEAIDHLPPLPPWERDEYYEESKLVGSVLGLTRDELPTDYDAFERYFQDMVDGTSLDVTPTGAALAADIIHPPISWLPRVAGDVVAVATAALLPEQVRRLYGLRWGHRRQWAWRVARRSLRRGLPYVPQALRGGRHARRGERLAERLGRHGAPLRS